MGKVWKPVLGKSRIGFQTSSLACEHNPWHRIVTTREGGLGLPVLFTPILKMTFPRPRLTCLGSPQLLKGRVPISRPTFFLSCLLSFTFQSPVKPEPEYKSELRLWLAGCPQGRHKFSKHSFSHPGQRAWCLTYRVVMEIKLEMHGKFLAEHLHHEGFLQMSAPWPVRSLHGNCKLIQNI